MFFARSSYLGCGFLGQYGYDLGEESVPGMRSHLVIDHELRITIRVCCNSTSEPDAAVRPLLSQYHHVALALFILSLRLRWDSQSGASSCLRRLQQSKARHLLCPPSLQYTTNFPQPLSFLLFRVSQAYYFAG
jgi:hypothetical protein